MSKRQIIRLLGLFFLKFLLFPIAYADTPIKSGRTVIYDNPFVALAENSKSNVVTGYVAALRTSPGRTDECKFVFQGRYAGNGISNLLIADAVVEPGTRTIAPGALVHGVLKSTGKKNLIIINQVNDLRNCEWILEFIGEPRIAQNRKQVELAFEAEEDGNWVGLNVVRSKRAYFYNKPDVTSKGKGFVVAGDLIYIYDENPEWYYVKYQNGKKETIGWIKKSDTVQFPEQR